MKPIVSRLLGAVSAPQTLDGRRNGTAALSIEADLRKSRRLILRFVFIVFDYGYSLAGGEGGRKGCIHYYQRGQIHTLWHQASCLTVRILPCLSGCFPKTKMLDQPRHKQRETRMQNPCLGSNRIGKDSSWVPIAPLSPKPTDKANRCILRHLTPKTLQIALYVGGFESGRPLQVVCFCWSQFPFPEAPSAGRPAQFTGALRCLAFSLQPFG